MVSRMADVNADAAVVGFYTSTNNGQVLATGGFVEALVGAQLSGAGVGSGSKAQPVARAGLGARPQAQLASGEANKAAKGIALVYGASLAFLELVRKEWRTRLTRTCARRHRERDAGRGRPQGVPPLAGVHRRVPLGQVRHGQVRPLLLTLEHREA